jgi:hypothetical protein
MFRPVQSVLGEGKDGFSEDCQDWPKHVATSFNNVSVYSILYSVLCGTYCN